VIDYRLKIRCRLRNSLEKKRKKRKGTSGCRSTAPDNPTQHQSGHQTIDDRYRVFLFHFNELFLLQPLFYPSPGRDQQMSFVRCVDLQQRCCSIQQAAPSKNQRRPELNLFSAVLAPRIASCCCCWWWWPSVRPSSSARPLLVPDRFVSHNWVEAGAAAGAGPGSRELAERRGAAESGTQRAADPAGPAAVPQERRTPPRPDWCTGVGR